MTLRHVYNIFHVSDTNSPKIFEIFRRFYISDFQTFTLFFRSYKSDDTTPMFTIENREISTIIPSDELKFTKLMPTGKSGLIYNHKLFYDDALTEPKCEVVDGSTTIIYAYWCLSHNKNVPVHCWEDAFILNNLNSAIYSRGSFAIYYLIASMFEGSKPKTKDSLLRSTFDQMNNVNTIKSEMYAQLLILPKVISVPSYNDVPKTETINGVTREIEYITQPYIQGFRIYVHVGKMRLQYYSKYGKKVTRIFPQLMHYVPKAVFSGELLIVPINNAKAVKSWHEYTLGSNFVCFLTDIFSYGTKPLDNLPFSERIKYAPKLYDELIRPLPPISAATMLYDAVGGTVYRRADGTPLSTIYSVKVVESVYYDMFSGECHTVDPENPPSREFKIYQNYTADKVYRWFVYSSDVEYLYVAQFDVDLCSYVHRFKVPVDPYRPKIVYHQMYETVLNALAPVKGFSVVSFYFLKDNQLLGYDQKITHTYYDISLDYL